jgi:ankyrin repeat protein
MEKLNEEFFTAVRENDLDKVRFLLEEGVDVNLKDEAEFTALWLAILYNNRNMAKLLLDEGADANLRIDDRTPLMCVSEMGYTDIAKLLLDSANVINCSGVVSLESALECSHEEIAKLLVQYGVDINMLSNEAQKKYRK